MIILGNAISLAASVLMVAIGLIKEKKKIVLAQCGQFALYAAANLVLGGIMGMVTNLVSIARNVISLKWKYGTVQKIVFTVIQAGLAAAVNKEGLLGWLPIIAAVSLTWFLDTKDEVVLKLVFLFGQVLWGIYDLNHMNYVGVAFDVFSFVTNIIGIKMVLADRKKAKEKE